MRDKYVSPFSTRYASDEMQYIFSEDFKFKTWRRLWVLLAKAQKQLGLNITDEQIQELEDNADNINYADAEKFEKETRHDVMSHVKAYGLQCPNAKGIIHLGATSCFVGDNTDLIIIKKGLEILKSKLLTVMKNLSDFALTYKDMPTLGYTHFQPAQLVTVGKRASLWLHDLYLDYNELEFVMRNIKLRGAKGTTGTQASFMSLFDNDHEKVKKLEELIAIPLGFEEAYPVTGQTYSRKVDSSVLNVLSQIAQSAYKFANDIRLLQNLKEIEEPFESTQIGSSAMAYKRNPMRSERICSISRYIITNSLNSSMTASTQWLERTLDDSANRRISLSEGFLASDSVLNIFINITNGLVVYPKVIRKHILEELPFMATETILMEAVKRGGDRQKLHERIRLHSMEASRIVKEEGKANNLLELISNDPEFNMTYTDLINLTDPDKFTGRSSEQVTEFITSYINPVLKANNTRKLNIELNV